MKGLENTLETRESGSGRAGNSPRLLRRATLSGRGFKGGWLESLFAGGFFCDLLADGVEVVHYVVVFETDHAHTEVLERNSTGGISSQSFRGVMLRAVEFYDQFVGRAVKVSDVLPDGSLSHPTRGLVVQKLIPKLALRWRQISAQLLRPRRQSFVVRQPSHQPILTHPHPQNPLPEGVAPRQRAGGDPRPPHPNLEVNL